PRVPPPPPPPPLPYTTLFRSYRNTWHFMWSVHSCHVAKSPLTCPAAAYTCGPRTTASRRVRWVVRLNSRTLYTGQRSFSWRVNRDRKSTRLNSSHLGISYAVF